MEEQRKCHKTKNQIHCFYIAKIRPSCWEVITEAQEQYELARSRIREEISKQTEVEYYINEEIMRLTRLVEEMEWQMSEVKFYEQWDPSIDHCTSNLVQVEITNGFFRLYGKDMYEKILYDKDDRSGVRPDRKRCQRKMIKKGEIDVEYLEQVQEELMTSKKSSEMTSCGTQQLNDLMESMARRIQHGSEKRACETKIYQEMKTINETKELYSAPEPPARHSQSYPRPNVNKKKDTDQKLSRQHKIKILLDRLENLKPQLKGHKSRVTRLKETLELPRKNISSLYKELENVTSKEDRAYERAIKLQDQKEEMKSFYAEDQSIMTNSEELIRKGDVVGLKQLCSTQVDRFMRQWCESKEFRDDYETRKLALKSQ